MTDLKARMYSRRGTKLAVAAVTDAHAGEVFTTTDTGETYIGKADGTTAPLQLNGDNLFNFHSSSGGGIRSTASYTTSSLIAGTSEDGSVTVPKAYSVLLVATNYPARVRMYLTMAQRTADAARPVTADPTGNHGCIFEVVTIAGVLSLDLSPVAIGASPTDSPEAYLSVTNDDVVSRAITVTMNLLSMES